MAPPVAVEKFQSAPKDELSDFYLWAGELAPYKRPDLAVEAFRRLNKPLIMLGGPEKTARKLRQVAGPKTQVLGRVSFAEMRHHMSRCKALIFPGEEDFGIVPVEVMASGRPVIAYGRGGARDSVVDGETGLFFEEQTVEGLMEAVERFEKNFVRNFSIDDCVAQAAKFSEAVFHDKIRAILPS